MTQHRVHVKYTGGKVKTFDGVERVEHWPSGLVELIFADGVSQLIKNFDDILVVADTASSTQTLRD